MALKLQLHIIGKQQKVYGVLVNTGFAAGMLNF